MSEHDKQFQMVTDVVKTELEMAYNKGITKALDLLHEIYAGDLYCLGDMYNRKECGCSCDDCLHSALKKRLYEVLEGIDDKAI